MAPGITVAPMVTIARENAALGPEAPNECQVLGFQSDTDTGN